MRDAVRDAGFAKPRIEGEENGEWIIVDCGAAVAHIMQPTIRQYYHLEELWGDKPVKLKLGAPAPLVKAEKTVKAEPEAVAKPKSSRATAKKVAKTAVKAPVKDHEPGYIGRVGKTSDWTAKRNEAETAEEPAARLVRKTPAKKAAAKTSAAKSAKTAVAADKPAAKKVARPAAKTAAKTPLVKIPAPKKAVAAKKAIAKTAAAKTTVKKPAAKKAAARKTASRSE